jgi:transcription initiation factor TFIIIB Brf1 subunit/transcription initiation factor TFIIB
MQRNLVAKLVPQDQVDAVLAKATVLWRLASFKAQSLGASAICIGPACVGIAASVLRVPCDLDRQAAAAGMKPSAFAKARNVLCKLLGVRLNLTMSELVRAAGCSAALERPATEVLEAYRAKDGRTAGRSDPDALVGAALLAASAKARAGIDKKRVEVATGATIPVMQAIASRMRDVSGSCARPRRTRWPHAHR